MTAPEPPVTKYELTVKIRGNTHDEIEDELLTLVHGGYLLDSDYGKRDAWNSGIRQYVWPWRILRSASIVGASSDSRQAAQHDGTVAMDGGRRSVGDRSGTGRDLVGDAAAYAG